MSTTPDVMTPEHDHTIDRSLQSILYSSYAYLHPRRPVWRVQVQGQLFSQRPVGFSKRILLRGLERKLKLTPEQSQSLLFQSRIDGFLATPHSGARVRIEHAAETYRLRQRSRRSGLFQGRIDIPCSVVALDDHASAPIPYIPLKVCQEFGESVANVYLAGQNGISIISDIDDTIKQTDVTSRTRMLARTFVEDFEPIPGMAELYRGWAERGALFHYVSSSPWQIYRPLQHFMSEHAFPAGSMHLKWFRLRDEFFKRWRIIRRRSKAGVIASMIKRMPYRKFLLIGDSGERDPEIYAKIAKRFPDQIIGCLIRDLEGRPIDGKRHQQLIKHFRNVPMTLFRDPSEVVDILP